MIADYVDQFLKLEESSMGHSVSTVNIIEVEYSQTATRVAVHLDILYRVRNNN